MLSKCLFVDSHPIPKLPYVLNPPSGPTVESSAGSHLTVTCALSHLSDTNLALSAIAYIMCDLHIPEASRAPTILTSRQDSGSKLISSTTSLLLYCSQLSSCHHLLPLDFFIQVQNSAELFHAISALLPENPCQESVVPVITTPHHELMARTSGSGQPNPVESIDCPELTQE